MSIDKEKLPAEAKPKKLLPVEIKDLEPELPQGWQVVESRMLTREYSFKNFKQALAFTNQIGKVAEEEKHHPEIELSFGKVVIRLSTHSVAGLSKKDFILAAKIEAEHAAF